ncbi:MAG TPA: MMPL family transporter, partial [Streptosporangiaceae bacterium]|nr:MMPL family transporter [Streptosporangiaceae bacterium]
MEHPSALLSTEPRPAPPPRPARRGPVVERIAGWSARHGWLALAGWLTLVIGSVVISGFVGTANLNSYDPGQAGQAERVLGRPGVVQPTTETVLVQARAPGRAIAGDPEAMQAVRQVAAALAAMPAVATDVRSPLSPGGHGLISRDGRSALVTFNVAGSQNNVGQTVAGALRAVAVVQARHPDLLVAESGGASVNRALNDIVTHDFRRAEVTSVPVTLVLLLCVFGALIAAGIPLLLAGSAVVTAIALVAIPSHWLPAGGEQTSAVILLIGMAVGVDYSLFYLRREREERAAGRSKPAALRIAAATSGRAIVVSGLTVMISLSGLFLTGVDVFSGVAVGTITVVGVAVLGSVTALPALLSLLGSWVDRGRVPFLGRRRTAARRSRLWEALARRVVARPALTGGVAALALVALAAPALGTRLANPGLHDLPSSAPVIQNLLATERAFPGGPAPEQVVVTGQDLSGPAVRHAVAALQGRAATSPALRQPVTATLLGHGQVLVVSVPLVGDGTDATSNHALATLRDQVLPATLGRVSGIGYAVTGITAANHDFLAQLDSRLPFVFMFVLGLAFLVLMVTFRSVTIPLVSIVLNLLSIGAAYGLLTLVFQHGFGHEVLGFSPYGAVIPWLPLFMFVFLFGLSMDYHVFILSRIREHRALGHTTAEAVSGGIGASAGVVTSAAVIMVSVFSIFGSLSEIEFKMFGVAMSSAIL